MQSQFLYKVSFSVTFFIKCTVQIWTGEVYGYFEEPLIFIPILARKEKEINKKAKQE